MHLTYTWIACFLAKDETFYYSYMQSAWLYFFTKESTDATVFLGYFHNIELHLIFTLT